MSLAKPVFSFILSQKLLKQFDFLWVQLFVGHPVPSRQKSITMAIPLKSGI